MAHLTVRRGGGRRCWRRWLLSIRHTLWGGALRLCVEAAKGGVVTVAIYDGFVTLDDEEIHVILGVDDDRVTMSSNGSEIGEWPADEVVIDHAGEGTYTITAENESLRFVPNDPDLFAIGFGPAVPAGPIASTDDTTTSPREGPGPVTDDENVPAPKPVTRVAFYALAVMTASLGLWALVSILLG